MIELKKSASSDISDKYQLFVNGVLVEGYAFALRGSSEVRVVASAYESEGSARLAAHLFNEIPAELEKLALRLDLDWPDTVHEVEVRRYPDDNGSFEIGFRFEFEI